MKKVMQTLTNKKNFISINIDRFNIHSITNLLSQCNFNINLECPEVFTSDKTKEI